MYRIVPMDHAHLEEAAALEQICFSMPWSREMLAEELDNGCSLYYAALDLEDGSLMGYAGMYVVACEGYITNVAVRPASRRMGVGSALLDEFVRYAEENCLALLTLEVRASNAGAIALYSGQGFQSVGRRPNYYEQPKEDAIIMTREFGSLF